MGKNCLFLECLVFGRSEWWKVESFDMWYMNIIMCLYRLVAYQRESLTGASRLIADRPGISGRQLHRFAVGEKQMRCR
jgi:hypothetical protein